MEKDLRVVRSREVVSYKCLTNMSTGTSKAGLLVSYAVVSESGYTSVMHPERSMHFDKFENYLERISEREFVE
ncbi:hypothetical protein GCM10007941_33380 [Amphritea balenae]|nr:hypothetical protein GCM10007941_33380 [Amphritea balenae]